jgi:hypothetical protein
MLDHQHPITLAGQNTKHHMGAIIGKDRWRDGLNNPFISKGKNLFGRLSEEGQAANEQQRDHSSCEPEAIQDSHEILPGVKLGVGDKI